MDKSCGTKFLNKSLEKNGIKTKGWAQRLCTNILNKICHQHLCAKVVKKKKKMVADRKMQLPEVAGWLEGIGRKKNLRLARTEAGTGTEEKIKLIEIPILELLRD